MHLPPAHSEGPKPWLTPQPLDYAAARAILQALPDLGSAHIERAILAAGRELSTTDQIIAAARLVLADRTSAPPRLVGLQTNKRKSAAAGTQGAYQPSLLLQAVPAAPPVAERRLSRAPDGTLTFSEDQDEQGRVTA